PTQKSPQSMAFDGTVFVTGFPGFIAGRLVKQLATEVARFFLLVQPAFTERARAEIKRIADDASASLSDFRLGEGHITQPALGLSGSDFVAAQGQTAALFHLAAIYAPGVAREVALRVNVGGTEQVNRFGGGIKNLRRYYYVSTCYVAGQREGVI